MGIKERYRWLFNAEDEEGEWNYLADDEFIGTYNEAWEEAARLIDVLEKEEGGLIMSVELERRGHENKGT